MEKIARIPFLLIVIALFCGCSSLIYHCEPRTGLYERRDDYTLEMFADTVDTEIQSELQGGKVETTWQEFWIDWCQVLYYDRNLGSPYIQYILDKRREAGLPDIPQIDKRQFKSEWQIFTDNVDKQMDREIKGFSPPYSTNSDAIEWQEHWKIIKQQAFNNPALSTNGVKYINEHRRRIGLSPLN